MILLGATIFQLGMTKLVPMIARRVGNRYLESAFGVLMVLVQGIGALAQVWIGSILGNYTKESTMNYVYLNLPFLLVSIVVFGLAHYYKSKSPFNEDVKMNQQKPRRRFSSSDPKSEPLNE